MEEIASFLQQLNKSLHTYKQLFPRPQWDKKTKDDLILDFTYHSNKIEGLGMSYGETISFLKYGLVENKQLENKETMGDITMLSNHQKALDLIFSQYLKNELTTEFIQNVHEQLLTTGSFLDENYTPGYYRGDEAMTLRPDGTTKYFLYDNQIPDAMVHLVSWVNGSTKNAHFEGTENHPFFIAVKLHVDFLNIHPFRDGNGRTARLLMNMVNMRYGIPPFSPKSDKENRVRYYETFDLVDKLGSAIPMVTYLGNQLMEIMETAIRKK